MCWRGNKQDRRVAVRDIETYKVMYKYEDKYLPYYMWDRIAYATGILYTQELNGTDNNGDYEIENGFHSYSFEKTTPYMDKLTKYLHIVSLNSRNNKILDHYCDFKTTCFTINPHWADGKDIQVRKETYIVKCIIPKDSVYYENEGGEIVSNQIIVTREEMIKKMDIQSLCWLWI